MNDAEREQQRVIDYRTTFKTEAGKRVLWDLLESCHLLNPSFNARAPDPCVTAFREGERNIGMVLLNRLQAGLPELSEFLIIPEEDTLPKDERATTDPGAESRPVV